MRQDAPNPVPFTLFFVICALGAAITQLPTLMAAGGMPVLWLPVGLITATLALSPWKTWPMLVVLGYIATTAPLVLRTHVPADAWFTAVGMVEAVGAGALLRYTVGRRFDLGQLTHVSLLYVAALVTPLIGAVAAAEGVRMTSSGTALVFTHPSFASWISDALGILLGAPLVFGWSRYPEGFGPSPRWRLVEAAFVMIALAAMSFGVFGDILPRAMQAPAVVLPLLLIAVFRYGPTGIVAAVLVVTLIALPETLRGNGPFAGADTLVSDALLRGKIIATTSTISLLLLASALAERRRIALERSALITELQQALAEIKTLRGFIPICAWCHKVRDDAGFWEGIEGYLQRHTDAVFSHGICPSCSAREHLALADQQQPDIHKPPTATT